MLLNINLIINTKDNTMHNTTLDRKTRNLILALFLIGVFMGSLDTGIIGPVLPSIEQSFSLTSREFPSDASKPYSSISSLMDNP